MRPGAVTYVGGLTTGPGVIRARLLLDVYVSSTSSSRYTCAACAVEFTTACNCTLHNKPLPLLKSLLRRWWAPQQLLLLLLVLSLVVLLLQPLLGEPRAARTT